MGWGGRMSHPAEAGKTPPQRHREGEFDLNGFGSIRSRKVESDLRRVEIDLTNAPHSPCGRCMRKVLSLIPFSTLFVISRSRGRAAVRAGRAEVVEGELRSVESELRSVEGEPRGVEGEPRSVEGEPRGVEGEPRRVEGEPRSVEDEPRRVEGEPRSVEGEPRRVEIGLRGVEIRAGRAVCGMGAALVDYAAGERDVHKGGIRVEREER
jgi:hypothetical protein